MKIEINTDAIDDDLFYEMFIEGIGIVGANDMHWVKASDITPTEGQIYLVKTNGGEWRDNDLHVWTYWMLKRYMQPEIVRGKPLWVAVITDPTNERSE